MEDGSRKDRRTREETARGKMEDGRGKTGCPLTSYVIHSLSHTTWFRTSFAFELDKNFSIAVTIKPIGSCRARMIPLCSLPLRTYSTSSLHRIPSISARPQLLQEHLHQEITESFCHCFQIFLIFIFGDVPLHFMHIIVIIGKRIVYLRRR